MPIDADSVRTVAEEVLMEVGDDTFSARQLLEAIRKNKTAEATINYLLDNGTGIESARQTHRQTHRQLDCITDAAMTGARMQSRVVSASRSRSRVWCGVVCVQIRSSRWRMNMVGHIVHIPRAVVLLQDRSGIILTGSFLAVWLWLWLGRCLLSTHDASRTLTMIRG